MLVAAQVVAYVLGLGLAAVAVDGLAKRVFGDKAPPPPLLVALRNAFLAMVVGLVLFAVLLRFDLHTWLLFGLPVAATAVVQQRLSRRSRARMGQLEPAGEAAATEQPVATSETKPKPSPRETVFAIGLAFAVAFAVRYLMLEAFTVPLSALAPSVMGKHFEVVCQRCGGQFTEMELGIQPPAALPCPGCGGPVQVDGGMKTQDRLLVEKLSQPARWDLAVFQHGDPDPALAGKLVSRIVGLPGESVEIGMGDVFINGQRLVKPADRLEQLWFQVGDTAWGGPGKPLNGWISETDESGPLLRYQYLVSAPLMTGIDERKPSFRVAARPVRDVRVEINLTDQRTGATELGWSVGAQQAVLEMDAGNTGIRLSVGDQTRSLPVAAKSSIGLAVRDGVVSALADGRVIGTSPLESQASIDHLEQARLRGTPCTLIIRASPPPRRIKVWRDVHYFTDGDSIQPIVRARLGEPFKLADNAYFVLADNSGIADDSRTYTALAPKYQAHGQVGALSRRMFIGVARWIYWPIHRAQGITPDVD